MEEDMLTAEDAALLAQTGDQGRSCIFYSIVKAGKTA
jgi:hypothetical protein